MGPRSIDRGNSLLRKPQIVNDLLSGFRAQRAGSRRIPLPNLVSLA